MDSAVTLTGPGGELRATFLPQAGMICNSLRHRDLELLGQRKGLSAYVERGSSFALPLLYPWANRLSGWDYEFDHRHVRLDANDPLIHQDPDQGVPMHGVLAGCPDWQLVASSDTELRAELDFGVRPARLRAFPFPHRLDYAAELSDTALTVTLTVTPTAGLAVPVCFGFHPFLNPGGERASWQLTGPVAELDGPLGDRSFDQGHEGVPGASFSVASPLRTLGVSFLGGYSVVQIFAPPGSDFVCFEPMTAPTDALRSGDGLLVVPPGQDFSASFAITVGP